MLDTMTRRILLEEGHIVRFALGLAALLCLTPPERPTSARQLAEIACALRERVALPRHTRYRLVGVGLAGFVERDSFEAQPDLFRRFAG